MRYVQAWFLALAFCLTSTAAPDLYADATPYYMAKSDGAWSTVGIWYTNTTGGTDPAGYTTPAAEAPNSGNSLGIIVNADVAVDADVTIDQTTINAGKTLTVNENVLLTVADGSGPDIVVTGTLGIAGGASVDCQGSFDATGGAVTFTGAGELYLSGELVSLGTLTPDQGTVGFTGSTNQTITGTNTFFNLIVDKDNQTDTVNATGSTLTVANGLMVTSGVLISASDLHDVIISIIGTLELSGDITVSGEWWNQWGTFTHNNHTVTLDGTNQYLFGSTTFYNLTKQVDAAATLEFEEGSTTTIENTLTLDGAPGQLLSLRSDWADNQWNINPQGTRNIAYVDVKDSNNANGTGINAGPGSVDSGNNVKWLFKAALTMAVSPGGGGVTTPVAGSTTDIEAGVAQDITAMAATGYHFVSWAASQAGNATFGNAASASTTVTLTGSATVTANFALNTYAITYSGNGATSGTAPASQTKTYGVDLTLETNTGNLARTGYTFSGWNTAADGSGTAYAAGASYMANAALNLYAKWTVNTYTLTAAANPGAGGTVTKNPSQADYNHGTVVQLTATANPNCVFTGWSGDLSGTTNPASLTMDGNKIVMAEFAAPQALANGKSSSFAVTVSSIEMFNGSAWVPLFAGTAPLDLVAGGAFPGVADLNLPQATYTKLRITFKNAFPTSGALACNGTTYYTTAATFGGQTNLASAPTTVPGSMAPYTFRMAAWGALNANVIKEFNITPITVTNETDYQPTLRFTLSNRLRLMGVSGSPGTYYFEHVEPGVSLVE